VPMALAAVTFVILAKLLRIEELESVFALLKRKLAR
jgi:hypothetical protein